MVYRSEKASALKVNFKPFDYAVLPSKEYLEWEKENRQIKEQGFVITGLLNEKRRKEERG